MKFLLIRVMVALGLLNFFKGTFGSFQAHAKESSASSSSRSCDTMGGRTGGCGKCR